MMKEIKYHKQIKLFIFVTDIIFGPRLNSFKANMQSSLKNKENEDGTEILRCHDSLLHINPWFDISSSGPSWAEGFYFNTC